jgi:hypothetical protein
MTAQVLEDRPPTSLAAQLPHATSQTTASSPSFEDSDYAERVLRERPSAAFSHAFWRTARHNPALGIMTQRMRAVYTQLGGLERRLAPDTEPGWHDKCARTCARSSERFFATT